MRNIVPSVPAQPGSDVELLPDYLTKHRTESAALDDGYALRQDSSLSKEPHVSLVRSASSQLRCQASCRCPASAIPRSNASNIPPPPFTNPLVAPLDKAASNTISLSPQAQLCNPPSSRWQNIPHVYSSKQLLPPRAPLARQGQWTPDDKVVYLPTFDSRVYVTCHPSTSVDFDRYLPLIKYAAEGKWHVMPDYAAIARLHGLEDAGLSPGHLPEVLSPHPERLEVPWVNGGAALRTPEDFKEIPCVNVEHAAALESHKLNLSDSEGPDLTEGIVPESSQGRLCRRCAKGHRAKLHECGLLYISVTKSTQDKNDFHIPPPPPYNTEADNRVSFGTEIYRVTKTGSREAAATQAFYNAGAKGVTTVFTCVVRGDVDWSMVAEEGVRRVQEPWELAEECAGPIPVFF